MRALFNSFQENCDEVVQMESENQELVVESFPFEQSDLRDDSSNEGRRTRRPPNFAAAAAPRSLLLTNSTEGSLTCSGCDIS
jgi:hypothetical protein